MVNILSTEFIDPSCKDKICLFSPDDMRDIFACAAETTQQYGPNAHKKFNAGLQVLARKFKAVEKPTVHKKSDDSTVVKYAKRSFSAKTNGKDIQEVLSDDIYDVLRSTIVIPLSQLNRLMDSLHEGAYIDSRRSDNLKIQIAEIENGIMNPEQKKCNIPSFDLKLNISYNKLDGTPKEVKAEIQFHLDGAQELLKESRDAYSISREAKDRMTLWDTLSKSNTIDTARAIKNFESSYCVMLKADAKRRAIHDKIRERFDLDGFKARRENLENDKNHKITHPQLHLLASA